MIIKEGALNISKEGKFNSSDIIMPKAIVGDATWFSVEFAGKRYPVKRIIAQSKDPEHGFDLVVIELDRAVPGIKPAKLYAGFDELHQVMTGVGYGISGPSNKIDSMKSRQDKIAGTNSIDLFEGESYESRQTMMRMDFDHPTDTTYNTTGSSTATPLEYLPMGGDSGGGLFIRTKSGWELAGLCNGGAGIKELMHTMRSHNYYGVTSAWLRVSVFRDWILKQIK